MIYCEEEDIEPITIDVAAVYNKILISVEDPNVKLREMSDQQFYTFLKQNSRCSVIAAPLEQGKRNVTQLYIGSLLCRTINKTH